jgi:hypothetical protein
MTERERYLFDLQGFLVVPGVLTESEVGELNGLLDSYDLWANAGRGRFRGVWTNDPNYVIIGHLHEWDEPFLRLLDHERIVPYLIELLGSELRYDHGHALLMRPGGTSLRLHGGHTPFTPSESYFVKDGQMYSGLLAVSYALVDAEPEHGGFAAIPGSHKANFACPREFLHFEEVGPWVVQVPVSAGDVILFTEALTHGTWPWTAEHERRALLLKYTPGHMAYGDPEIPGSAAASHAGPRHRLLRRPYVAHREATFRAESDLAE